MMDYACRLVCPDHPFQASGPNTQPRWHSSASPLPLQRRDRPSNFKPGRWGTRLHSWSIHDVTRTNCTYLRLQIVDIIIGEQVRGVIEDWLKFWYRRAYMWLYSLKTARKENSSVFRMSGPFLGGFFPVFIYFRRRKLISSGAFFFLVFFFILSTMWKKPLNRFSSFIFPSSEWAPASSVKICWNISLRLLYHVAHELISADR